MMPSTELYDIVLPLDPGLDMGFWLQLLLTILLGLAVLALLVWWLKNAWLPLKLQMMFRGLVWRQAALSWPRFLMQCQVWRQTSQPFWQTQTDYAQLDFKAFCQLLDQACYGAQNVSRETLMASLSVAAQQAQDLALTDSRHAWQQRWHRVKRTFWQTMGKPHD